MQIVTVAMVILIGLGFTSPVRAQGPLPINCQLDFGCLVQASADCSQARVESRVAILLADTELESTQSYEILGMEGNHCLFRSRVQRVATPLQGGGAPREQLERQRQVIAAILSGIQGSNVTCRFARDELTELLTSWTTGSAVANADLDRHECTGSQILR